MCKDYSDRLSAWLLVLSSVQDALYEILEFQYSRSKNKQVRTVLLRNQMDSGNSEHGHHFQTTSALNLP